MYQVLIVDDEPIVKIALQSMLNWEDLGFCICALASNGKEALDMAERFHPDLIICDLKMPVLDGLALIRTAKETGMDCEFLVISNYEDLRLVALMNHDKVVAEGILSLSELLKNTLVKDNECITIQEEIDNLKHYFSIQAIRYAGSFHVNYEIAPETASFLVPKLILQPLAENSVLHGSYNDGTVMEIYVTSRFEGSDIVLEIKDEGKGFDPSNKAAQSKGLGGIGTRNVNDRIHL